MPDLISDGAEFSCPGCPSKLKLTVNSSSSTGDSKKLANKTNCFLPPPGGPCNILPGPPPCAGVPPGMVTSTGQTTVTIDGQTALGKGAAFTCPVGGQTVSVSSPGQTVAKHDEASGGLRKAALEFVLENWDLLLLLIPGPQEVEGAVLLFRLLRFSVRQLRTAAKMNKIYKKVFKPKITQRPDGKPRTVYQRKDIKWDDPKQRDDGLTNREAMKKGKPPMRQTEDGKYERMELHHHQQEKDGALVELWESEHQQVPHNRETSWRKLDPQANKDFNKERVDYWKSRTE